MSLLKFNDFRNKRLESISENVAAGKKLLKEIELVTRVANKSNLIDRELENKIKDGKRALNFTDFSGDSLSKIKDGIKEIKLDKREIEKIEKNEDFEKIKKLLVKNSGYVYNFAYFYFVEDVPFEELEKLRDSFEKGSDIRLLISLYTMMPPVRSDYYKVKIYKDEKLVPKDDTNFIVLNSKPYIALRKYKTSKTYNTIKINIPKNYACICCRIFV